MIGSALMSPEYCHSDSWHIHSICVIVYKARNAEASLLSHSPQPATDLVQTAAGLCISDSVSSLAFAEFPVCMSFSVSGAICCLTTHS